MSGYVPNPYDPTNPTDATIAETAQAEFRALKTAFIAGGLPNGWSNLVINGRMEVDRINFGVETPAIASGVPIIDEWIYVALIKQAKPMLVRTL